jgi:hypothetical protein
MRRQQFELRYSSLKWVMATAAGLGLACQARALPTSESIQLATGPGVTGDAGNLDMVVQTGTNAYATWGEKGATGLQGSGSYFYNGSSYVNMPPSIVAMKFQLGPTTAALNAAYPNGWTIANPQLTVQYTYYANNSVFGGGAGSFETYLVQNNNWKFNGGAGSAGAYSTYVAGTDPLYEPNATALATWSQGQADLGSTTYNWLSPSNPPGEPPGMNAPVNPNYSSWSTDKSGANQGLLTVNLADDPLLVSDIVNGTSNVPTTNDPTPNGDVSFYMIPNDNTLGLTIFTGGGNSLPTLSFDVVPTPEPATLAVVAPVAALALARRRRRL